MKPYRFGKNMNWEAKPIKHKGQSRIAVYFEKNAELIARFKKMEDARWSQTLKAWHVPDNEENRLRFKLDLPIVFSEINIQKIAQFKRWLSSKRYSENTIKTYTDALKTFLKYYHNKPIEQITNDDVIAFNNDYILKNNFSSSFQNQVVQPVGL